MNKRVLTTLGMSAVFLLVTGGIAYAGDPSGASLSGKAAYDALYSGKPLAEAIGRNAIAINFVMMTR